VYTPVPCEEVCPVGAISKDSSGVEHIDWRKCIHCGKCSEACPYGAIMEKTYLVRIINKLLNPQKKVVAMVAPAIAGQYKASLSKILGAVKSCGFDEVVEVALGANITSKNEADEWEERVMKNDEPFMTTSCCPSYVTWAKKYLPEIVPYISHTKTPVSYTADLVKEKYPESFTVFIGPCVAKRVEGFYDPNIDFVMTFEEINAMIEAKGIDIESCESFELDPTIDRSSRQYARTSGVASSVAQYVRHPGAYKPELVNGLNNESMKKLKEIALSGKSESNLFEVMMCEGGCVNGCGVLVSPKVATRQLLALDKVR
jgi:iron only hydrogenase large subunit-like protein